MKASIFTVLFIVFLLLVLVIAARLAFDSISPIYFGQ